MTLIDRHIDEIRELISKEYGIRPIVGQRESCNLGGAREIRFQASLDGTEKSAVLTELLGAAIRIKMFDGKVGTFSNHAIEWK